MNRHALWSFRIWFRAAMEKACPFPFGDAPDHDPPDAINPYAKPYDEALAGHLRNWEPKLR